MITVESFGIMRPHTVKVIFELPYHDWCAFQKSDLYRCLEEYLEELKKRDAPKQKPDMKDLFGEQYSK